MHRFRYISKLIVRAICSVFTLFVGTDVAYAILYRTEATFIYGALGNLFPTSRKTWCNYRGRDVGDGHMRFPWVYSASSTSCIVSTRAPVQSLTTAHWRMTYNRILSPSFVEESCHRKVVRILLKPLSLMGENWVGIEPTNLLIVSPVSYPTRPPLVL